MMADMGFIVILFMFSLGHFIVLIPVVVGLNIFRYLVNSPEALDGENNISTKAII